MTAPRNPYGSLPTGLRRLLRLFFELLYTRFAWTYDLVAKLVSAGQWYEWVAQVLPYLEGTPILEIGYGTGHLLELTAREGFQIFGVDASRWMGHIAFQRVIRSGAIPKLVNGYAQSLPFLDGVFETIVATFPAEYILEPEAVQEISRALRPGGVFITIPTAWIEPVTPVNRFLAWLFRFTRQAPPSEDPEFIRSFSSPFQTAGFEVDAQRVSLKTSTVLVFRMRKPVTLKTESPD